MSQTSSSFIQEGQYLLRPSHTSCQMIRWAFIIRHPSTNSYFPKQPKRNVQIRCPHRQYRFTTIHYPKWLPLKTLKNTTVPCKRLYPMHSITGFCIFLIIRSREIIPESTTCTARYSSKFIGTKCLTTSSVRLKISSHVPKPTDRFTGTNKISNCFNRTDRYSFWKRASPVLFKNRFLKSVLPPINLPVYRTNQEWPSW